ncbi:MULTISPECIES: hypothetical protein [unclassified Bacillus (in: firmicutes)]|uniref:hypothetical protein n=1 Tax=unclassified Bacillus (in: firmicutes) TaxID=185979 RepID=UPI001BEBE0E1|nr:MULTISPECIES: hypothetical protein [unclassified Bacillus (in: firmicutes)]MBT2617640.1 hypothetical protein [Bacillus sp. ISL-78]MBT2631699.1 hypothetical protein [Bacillus sp. ISL-101]MBT2715930.1 hypothetical protein [Bacillus sp. ISL-57]
MKRYLCSIIIGMVVILSIGTYYVKFSSASSLPKYTFKTLEGSDKELDPVIIHATLENGSFYEPLTFESNTTTYASERSYLENLTGRQDHQIERLIKEHRSFMRGKDSISSLYKDDDFLAYAWVNSEYTKSGNMEAEFDIGLLEKKDEEETSFQVELPNQGRIMNVDVRDVQLVHSKLQVLTMNDVNSNNEKETKEVHLYTIDVANKKVLSDKTLVSESFTYPNQVDFEMPTDVAPSQPNNMVFFSLIKGVNHEDGFEEKLKESKLLSYNYETEKLETVKKGSLSLDMERSGYADVKNLYTVEMKSGKYRIKTFDLSSQTLTNDTELDLAANKKEQVFAAIKNGRVYFLLGNEVDQDVLTYKPAKLLIADIKTGKTLYKGETVMNKKNSKSFGLFINDLEVK